MRITLKINLKISGTGLLVQDGFVNVRREEDIVPHAHQWIRKIWIEHGCRDLIFDKVIWNEENDITDEVKKYSPKIVDNLPF
jgi:hypothetical protein